MRSFLSVLCALCTGQLVTADFTQPDSSQGDFYQSWRVGDTIDIAWNAGWDWGKGAQPDVADLFVMWFEHPAEFSQLVLANVSLSTGGNCTWKVDVSDDKVAQEPKFVFRFSQHTEPEVFDMDLPRMPSRGFILSQKAVMSVASSFSIIATTKTTSVVSATSNVPARTAEGSEPTPASNSSTTNIAKPSETGAAAKENNSNAAAIAAGVLGGLVGLAVILGGVLLLLRQARKSREAGGGEGHVELVAAQKGQQACTYPAQELPGAPPSELAGDRYGQSQELNGSTPRDWH